MSGHLPLFDLEVSTPRLVLRPLADTDLEQLTDLAVLGIHDPATMPFSTPWTDQPREEQPRSVLQYAWLRRAELSPDNWSVAFGVWEGKTLVGCQDVLAKGFPVARMIETGSWLGFPPRPRVVGYRCRAPAGPPNADVRGVSCR